MLTQVAVEKTGLYQLGEIRGEQRSEIRTLQHSIINILMARFQQIPESIKNNLLATKDIKQLNRLLIKAINIDKPERL